MDGNLLFLNLEGLDDSQVKHLNGLLNPSVVSPDIEFPWTALYEDSKLLAKNTVSSLNVHAPVFEAYVPKISTNARVNDISYAGEVPFKNGASDQTAVTSQVHSHYPHSYSALSIRTLPQPAVSNGSSVQKACNDQPLVYAEPDADVHIDFKQPRVEPSSTATFKLNPAVSCFVPSSFQQSVASTEPACEVQDDSFVTAKVDKNVEAETVHQSNQTDSEVAAKTAENSQNGTPKPRSWADIVSKGPKSGDKHAAIASKPLENGGKFVPKDSEIENLSLEEDKLALVLGKHLHQLELCFKPVFLQPRGLINRRNWCYINATLQALLACPPFYTLLKNIPVSNNVDRGKSASPVIDSMVKMAQEFSQYDSPQEELQPGQPFQPDFIYEMLKDMKSDCLKGQQEDAEEFLSFILNGMHEEMVKIIKYYEKKNNLSSSEEMKENGDVSDGEDEWQVITGSKHKAMVTRKVVEHRTPVSELLGGQIKSFLTTSGSKTSASIQPFFTLQLDVQSENVTSVSEALKEMTLKEPIQGYTCAKTKQEVEAYSHVALQKLPPILILHLKRFVYNKNGGCKKVLKKTDYPLELELSRDLFSSDVKKSQRVRLYKLFAVMYHDGEEAIKGHYISDVYNHGCQTWMRCDDRTISIVTEAQVLSHSPPRVPYLLFYQES